MILLALTGIWEWHVSQASFSGNFQVLEPEFSQSRTTWKYQMVEICIPGEGIAII